MIVLKAAETLTVTLGGANSHDFTVSGEDIVFASGVQKDSMWGVLSTNVAVTTETTISAAPATGATRNVMSIFGRNNTASSTTVLIKKVVGTTHYSLTPTFTLASGEAFIIDTLGKLTCYLANGAIRTT